MSEVLDEVMRYANEDVAKIHKHWVIFLKTTRRIIIFSVVLILAYRRWTDSFEAVFGWIDEFLPEKPFSLGENAGVVLLFVIFMYALVKYIKTLIVYKTVGLEINNIQIKGVSGLADIGQINVPLDQIESVKTHSSLIGRWLGYGRIEVALGIKSFTMEDMEEVEKFQNALVLLQEAQKEGRHFRSDARHEETIMKQTMAQVQAMTMISETVNNAVLSMTEANKGISQANNIPIETNSEVEAIIEEKDIVESKKDESSDE